METQTQYREGVGTATQSVFMPMSERAIFRKEGEYWTVGFNDSVCRLKDTKGFAYVAHLLRHPTVEFHALDLAGRAGSQREHDEISQPVHGLPRTDGELERLGIQIATLGDAGEMLDQRAKSAYRHRLAELREEFEQAKERGNVELAERAEQEIDALTRELSRAVGLGGRNRRAASASERARQTVTKTIRAVIQRIARSDAAVGQVLTRSIRTGTFCSYKPDPDLPIQWQLSDTVSEPSGQTIPAITAAVNGEYTLVSPAAPGTVAFSTTRRTAFVNREFESAVLRGAIERAQKGSGSLLMLTGGSGVGKTRLASEMVEYAAGNGFACFLGRCYERDEPVPYLPFVQTVETMIAQAPNLDGFRQHLADNASELSQLVPSLRRIFPDLPEPIELPDIQRRRCLFQSMSEVLRRAARIRPHLLILDDLQWADESTLALLTHLVSTLARVPLVIIGTYRDDPEDNPTLARTLEELIRLGVRPLKLTGLSKDSVAQMLNGLAQQQVPDALVSAIFAETNGNPFFVEEVYQHLIGEGKIVDSSGHFRTQLEIDEIDVPDNVRLMIARRLKHFTELEIRALGAAAIIGRSFSFQLLTAVTEIDVDRLFTVLDKAQQTGIIVPSSDTPQKPFTFSHELVRQTLLCQILIARRQQLHAKVAAALEHLHPTALKEHAGEIADHLRKAGEFAEPERLARWLIQAGNAALEAAAFEAACNNFVAALAQVDGADSRRRAELLYSLGIAQRGLGRTADVNQ